MEVYWEPKTDPNRIKVLEELADKLAERIRFLGEVLIISDPYFIGDLQERDERGMLPWDESLAVFTAALIRAKSIDYRNTLTSLKVVFCQNINFDSWKPYLLELSKFIENIEVYKSQNKFHDRHWLGKGMVLHIGTSVNTIAAHSSLSITRMQGSMADDLRLAVEKAILKGEQLWSR